MQKSKALKSFLSTPNSTSKLCWKLIWKRQTTRLSFCVKMCLTCAISRWVTFKNSKFSLLNSSAPKGTICWNRVSLMTNFTSSLTGYVRRGSTFTTRKLAISLKKISKLKTPSSFWTNFQKENSLEVFPRLKAPNSNTMLAFRQRKPPFSWLVSRISKRHLKEKMENKASVLNKCWPQIYKFKTGSTWRCTTSKWWPIIIKCSLII